MLVVGSLLSQATPIVGLMAGAIAVGGFIGHAGPILADWEESAVRKVTVVGGPWGLGGVVLIMVLSAGGV